MLSDQDELFSPDDLTKKRKTQKMVKGKSYSAHEIEDLLEESFSRKKKKNNKPNKKQFLPRKPLQQLLSEETTPNYLTMQVRPSKYPRRRFCCICGHFAKYTCTRCSERSCSRRCYGVHRDIRCLRFAD